MSVVIITRTKAVVTMTLFSVIVSSICKTSPNAIAPLISPEYPINVKFFESYFLLMAK